MRLGNRQRLLLRVSGIVGVVVAVKLLVHDLGWEVISINPLFSGIVAANIFLMGFLLSGVLSDYKESERLPGELSASLQNLAQEIVGLSLAKPGSDVTPSLRTLSLLAGDLLEWFHKKRRTGEVLDRIDALTPALRRDGSPGAGDHGGAAQAGTGQSAADADTHPDDPRDIVRAGRVPAGRHDHDPALRGADSVAHRTILRIAVLRLRHRVAHGLSADAHPRSGQPLRLLRRLFQRGRLPGAFVDRRGAAGRQRGGSGGHRGGLQRA